MQQKTLKHSVEIKGKALHSGRLVKLSIHPATADTGIVFCRTDSSIRSPILAHATNISSTELSTSIGEGPSSVSTIEHLMAAFYLLGIDNAYVEVDGPEIPILDGSAAPFISHLMKSGLTSLPASVMVYKVIAPFEFSMGESLLKVEPAQKFSARCTIDFDREVIGRQTASFSSHDDNIQSLVESRTFCHINDVNAMRRRGLALGGSLENAVVISDTDIINEEGLRSGDEFAKHKLLDLIGDLALLGRPLIGKVTAFKPGHTVHANFMWELLSDKDNYLLPDHAVRAPRRMEPFSQFAFG